jgi:hypothetical protein
MTKQRSSFMEEGEPDPASFTPAKRPPIDRDAARQVAERHGFPDRDPAPRATGRQRRNLSGRNQQFNARVTQATLDQIYDIADAQRWVLGEVIEHAIAALTRELGGQA